MFLPGRTSHLVVAYPALHWLMVMLLGFCFGNALLVAPREPTRLTRPLLVWGGAALVGFAIVRGRNGYGNMGLYREDGSLVQWLHVSKYPPGLSYLSLELGLCFLCLAGFFWLSARRPPRPANLLLVLGQTPLFFYLLHFPLLVLSARLLGVESRLGLGATFLGAAGAVLVLYPACRAYRRYKAAHKSGWARFI